MKVFPEISGLKILPDAPQHMQFLMQAERAIMGYIQQDAQKKAQAQAMAAQQATSMGMGGGQPGMPGMGGPPGAGGPPGMGGPPQPPQQMAPGGGAGMAGMGPAAAGGADELRRMLAGPPGVGG